MSDLRKIISREGLTFVPENKNGEEVFNDKEQEKDHKQLNIEAVTNLESANKFIEKEDWDGLKALVESLPDNGLLMTQTAFLQELHERLFAHQPSWQFDKYNTNYQKAYDLGLVLIEKMGSNEYSLPYLKDLIMHSRIPKVAEYGASQKFEEFGSNDRDVSWNYFKPAVDKIVKLGGPNIFSDVKEIWNEMDEKALADIEEGNIGYANEDGGPLTMLSKSKRQEEDKWAFFEYLRESDHVHMIYQGWGPENFKRHVLKALGDSGNPEFIKLILELLNSEGYSSFRYVSVAVEAISKLDPNFLSTVTSLLEQNNVQLQEFNNFYNITLLSIYSEKHRAKLFRSLAEKKFLSPVPEIHWRVDRSMEEYRRRLGVDLKVFLASKVVPEKKQILLEIGPGSGEAKKERFGDLLESYVDYGLSDKIYYPLTPVIKELIDFRKLGIEDEQEKEKIADFIYKVLVIKEAQTAEDDFEYDTEVTKSLAEDINNLKTLWSSIQKKLNGVQVVPSGISNHENGRVVYKQKVDIGANNKLAQALSKLQNNFAEYIQAKHKETDYFSLIPAYPPNVMLGDMQNIDRLKEGQIDVELASRSTVYTRGADYELFLKKLEKVLATNGVALDDSIRDNDGHYYRIAEVLKAKKNMEPDTEVLVILGKPFKGEDYNQEGLVPLSMVITKRGSAVKAIEPVLEQGNKIISIEDLAKDKDYLKSLDASGKTLAEVEKLAA